MSGHSKWATIHRDKEANDSKRGAAFTKLAHAITVAARQKEEYKLRLAVEKARSMSMPKDNIQRAIDRATGAAASALEEVLFEGFLPGGVVVLAEGLTDNKLRTAQEVRLVLEKNGGKMGGAGAVQHYFSQMGEIKVDGTDIECTKEKLTETKDELEEMGYKIESVELVYKPNAEVTVSDPETRSKIENILNKLDDLDDIGKVWTNYA